MIIKDIYGLHCKRVKHQLLRLFREEIRLFFCRSCTRYTTRSSNVNKSHKKQHNSVKINNEKSSNKADEDQTKTTTTCILNDIPPFIEFCDELRYHYGTEAALFFAFSAFCFRQLVWLSIILIPISICNYSTDNAKVSLLLDGIFGMLVLLVWAPIFTRLWQRTYCVLRIRWSMDSEAAKITPFNINTQQSPMQEVSSDENPNNPNYFWKYDELLRRKVRVYITFWRPIARILLLPLTWILLIIITILFTLFALWSGLHMMVLPSCDDCQYMLDQANAGPESFYKDPTVEKPYAVYTGYNNIPASNRTYNEFIYSWSDNLTDVSAETTQCLPNYCSQESHA